MIGREARSNCHIFPSDFDEERDVWYCNVGVKSKMKDQWLLFPDGADAAWHGGSIRR